MSTISVIDSFSIPFLHDYVIESVTMENPEDPNNGEAIMMLSKENERYEMIVEVKEGKKEGVGLILRENGTSFIKLRFVNDVCEGEVIKMNEQENIVMRGRLERGKEVGLFIEYDDNGKKMWRGLYRNGKRYSTMLKRRKGGLVEERNMSKELLRVSGFDEEWRRNGVCYEYKSGKILNECVYEHGEMKRMIREFIDDKMRVFDDEGRIVYEGVWFGDIVNGFVIHPKMEGMDGFFKEMNEKGELLSVSEYDNEQKVKEGKCFEFEGESGSRM